MPVRLNSSGGGSVTLDVPSTAGTFTLNLPAADGSVVAANNSGLVNFSQRPTVNGAPIGINLGTAQNSTSGTSIDFTGIPAGVRRVTVMFRDISTNGSNNLQIQLGTSAGIDATNYLGAESTAVGATAVQNSTGFIVKSNIAAAGALHGIAFLSLLNPSTNLWVESGTLATSNTTQVGVSAGSKALSGPLDRIRITTVNGTDVFDAGTINVAWEF
ncbi:hypothetical protein UFOVP345_43 [uncultured Caudovirales phage]|uniref:Uncharacterized protein n=1 Tax=uncultured Caudovirales phage TaxID=2100421 RepID=A0A6J5M1L8_9CAUD|nr:hypothetical protein UFOVP345_43 [uncultured Caudovirales phage]